MILDILNELESDNSRLAKEAILTREKNNLLLKRVFSAALNPLIQYYIRKIPPYENIQTTISLSFAIDLLSVLSKRTKTGHAGIEHLKFILENLDSDDAKVIERIIAKDLKCGVSTSTVNKIWPGLIPEFPVMLASKYDQKLIDKIEWPAIAQLKSDGMRTIAFCGETSSKLFSRNGKELDVLGELDEELSKYSGYVLDGELMVWDENFYQFISRKEGNGILNKANKGTISKEEAKRICYVVWDIIPAEKYVEGGEYHKPYRERLSLLTSINNVSNKKIRMIESYIVSDIDEARVIFNNYLSQGLEGIILKTSDGIWEDKRSKGLIKFKAELEADLLCVGIEPGQGKYEGKVGSLICESADGSVKTNVGSGLTDADRERDDYVGKIIAVKYNEIISNSKGERSLFLPIYIETRIDKDVADKL